MSRSLASYNEREKLLAILRRLKQDNRGTGFWAAFDAIRHYPAASLSLELMGTYLDIEKSLNKGGQNEKPKSRSRKNVKRSKKLGMVKASIFSGGSVPSQKVAEAAAVN